MSIPNAADALALLTAAAASFDLPAPPGPDAGVLAWWGWLRAVNAGLSIPDAQFRWMFGGISIPILLLLDVVGVRKDWKLYPFLLPFWLIFGSIALGVVGGLAATAAHLVLFPVGRVWFTVRDRSRAGGAAVRAPAPEGARPGAPATAAAAPPRLPRRARDVLRAALEAIAAAAAEPRGARPPAAVQGQPQRPPQPTGAAPAKPDLGAFRPDLSRFRRRPPRG